MFGQTRKNIADMLREEAGCIANLITRNRFPVFVRNWLLVCPIKVLGKVELNKNIVLLIN
jgi:hypothetical protein